MEVWRHRLGRFRGKPGPGRLTFSLMRIRRALSTLQLTLICLCCHAAFGGGPRWVAGSAYFNSSALGKPVVWAGGQVIYYTDQGALSSYESNTAAASMVALAAAPWTQVPTASVTITQGGTLSEDVSGANVSGSRGNVVWPADVESAAMPVAVVYDADGSVLDAVLGASASDPSGCLSNAVYSINDGFSTAGNLTHAIIILNGLCATDSNQIANMQYLLTREFGRVLGLDYAQDNDNVWTNNPPPTGEDYAGWPLMHPINVNCGGDSYSCVLNASALKMDDRAALGRLYPSSTFSSATIRVHGIIHFAGGQGMQGVNVKATILQTKKTIPQTDAVASCVSGFTFRGNAGNAITGTTDSAGYALARFGSSVASGEGEYELSGLEVPAGIAKGEVDYEITFEAINPVYTGAFSVGPDTLGAPAPSGTLATIILREMKAGSIHEENVTVTNSATGTAGIGGSFAAPTAVPATGEWQSWISGYGDTEWSSFAARPNRQFAVITQAFNEGGAPTQSKAMPVIGAWFVDDAPGAPPDFSTSQAFDSSTEGVTMLEIATPGGDGTLAYPMVAAIADARGDGRPDYAYSARIFYADSVAPNAISLSGGVVAIAGTGFVAGDSVLVNGANAPVLSVSARQLVVQAPAQNTSGAVDIQVNDSTGAMAVMSGALVYGSGGTSSAYGLNVVSLPGGSGGSSGTVGAVSPGAFTVQVVDSNGNSVAGAPVTFSDSNGSQLSACGGGTNCTIAASSSGIAGTTLTPANAGIDTIAASLNDGVSAQASWTATRPAEVIQFANLPLEMKYAQTIQWPLSVTAVSNGIPIAGAKIIWTVYQNNEKQAGATTPTSTAGVASYTAKIAPLAYGPAANVQACLADGTCATIYATGVTPDLPVAIALSGSSQTIASSATFAPLVLEITDGAVPGNPLAGVSVGFTQTLYSYEPQGTDGKQPPPRVLATSTQAVVSDANGMVQVQPLQQAGTAGTAVITATIAGRVAGTYTLLAEPTVAPVNGGPVAPRRFIHH
jgi:hypothetical protein